MRRSTPAIERNREPIAAVLATVLPATGTVIEIASGPGAHAAFFAERFAGLSWQPSDLDDGALVSASAWVSESGLPNLNPPIRLDVSELPWPIAAANAVLNINMLHVSPFPRCASGLFAGSAAVLGSGEPLIVYGPFVRANVPTAASNLEFDRSLRSRNPEWGLRSLDELRLLAQEHDLELDEVVDMPANNSVLVFRRA